MRSQSRFVDLHVHTNFSDSSLGPEEVVHLAARLKLAAIAITDHDCIGGIAPAREVAPAAGVEIVPGVELTAQAEDTELHILGLGIETHQGWLKSVLDEITRQRRQRMCRMIELLNARGIRVSLEEVIAISNSQLSLGRLHLARALAGKKIVSSVQEAFTRFIGRRKPCYVKRLVISPEKAIDIVRQARGIAVLAHPGIADQDDVIPRLVRAGLGGIEVIHTDHSASQTEHYRRLAQAYGLVETGGSDCHGVGKGEPLLGTVNVPYKTLEILRARKAAAYESGVSRSAAATGGDGAKSALRETGCDREML